ncbi:MAG: hypothetical protein JW759_04405 [Candidatus Coatesbacteria bacterium]|nr:hypothetical protein [Candidatus Coatesbacteria bacterium]
MKPLSTDAASAAPRWPRLRELLIILFLTAFAIAVTWPVAPRITREIFGSWGDVNLNFWNYWWFRYSIFELKQSPFFCPIQLYPDGADLAFHTLCPLNQIIALPLHILFGIRFAYNFIVFFSLVMAAYTAYRLAYDVCGHRIAAVAAGVMFGFSPYMLVRATGHINLIGAWPLPLVAMFAMRAFKNGRFRWAALAGLFAGLQLWIDMYYTLFAAILFVFLWINAALFERRTLRRLLWCPAITAAAALAAASPMLFIMIRSVLRSGAFFAPPTWMSFTGGVDLLAFFVPGEFSMLFGKLTWRAYGHLGGGCVEGLAFAGVLCLVFAALSLRAPRSDQKRLWVALALLFALASLGDRLQVLKHDTWPILGTRVPIPLPAALLKSVPILNLIRIASRFVILYQLSLALLASQALARFLGRFSGRRNAVVIVLLFLSLFADLSNAPYMTTPMRFGKLYERIRDLPGRFSIIDVPFWAGDPINFYGANVKNTPRWLAAQTEHRKPIVSSFASRVQPAIVDRMERSPLISAIVSAEGGRLTDEILHSLTPESIQRELDYYQIKIILAHRPELSPHSEGQLASLFSHIGFKLLYKDDEVAVIETPLGPSLEGFVPKSDHALGHYKAVGVKDSEERH